MRKLFLLLTIVTAAACANAQVTERTIVKAGEDFGKAISPAGHFQFAQFTDGMVVMKYGSKSKARFNFHICNGEMQFIHTNGDTLVISETTYIDYVLIGDSTKFIFADKYFHEVLAESAVGKLCKRIKVNVENDRKTGFGKSDPTASQMQLNNVMLDQRVLNLLHDVEVLKTTSYVWLDDKNNTTPVTKKTTLKLVAKDKQSKLQSHIDQNKTDFNKVEDLRKLLEFAATTAGIEK